MVVCKFFQQGNCRFGQSCRFEHVYGSKYSYHAPAHPQAPSQQTSSVTDEQLANQVHSDVQAALNGGQWLLSCYAPFKEKPCIPGISDLSPEEARLFIYQAKANNNIEASIAFINKQIQENRAKFEQLLHPNVAVMNQLKNLYHGGTVQSPFMTQNQGFGASNSSNQQTANSIFRSAIQNTGFGQTNSNSIFGQTSNSFNNQQNSSFFGSQQDPAQSIFASANQNVFGTTNSNPFQSAAQDSAKSIFAQATQNVFGATPQTQASTNVFGSTPSAFGQSDIFKQNSDVFAPSQVATSNIFQISDKPTTNVFGNVAVDPIVDEGSIYSKMGDLCPSDIEAYQASTFKLGFVPELPPPADLCR